MLVKKNNLKAIDLLTKLSNRDAVENFLEKVSVDSSKNLLHIISFEISYLDGINDGVENELDKAVIKVIARRLRASFKNAELIARTKSSQYCLVFKGPLNIDDQVQALKELVKRPLVVERHILVLDIKIGISKCGTAEKISIGLLHSSEIALNKAKRSESDSWFYHSNLEIETRAIQQMEGELRTSMIKSYAELQSGANCNEFLIYYQPIVDVLRKKVHSMEALIRWNHPTYGLISPDEFIPLCEKLKMMELLGGWVMRRACKDAASFPKNGDGSIPGVSINTSAKQFTDSDTLLLIIKEALEHSGINPNAVTVEITESTILGMNKRDVIEDIKKLGCKIALDDFGTGYSSLSQLNLFPFDYAKLDHSFIKAMCGDDEVMHLQSDRMARAVLLIADTFNVEIVVEGVENSLQQSHLQQLGAKLMQGFLYSTPIPLDSAKNFISTYSS